MTAKKMSFEDRALKYLKHTLYCRWERPEGRYDSGKPCTCGRDDFFREIVKLHDALQHTECAGCGHMASRCTCDEAWRLESMASDARLRDARD